MLEKGKVREKLYDKKCLELAKIQYPVVFESNLWSQPRKI